MTVLVAFPIEDFDTRVVGSTRVTIPMLNYDNSYTVHIKFDAESLKAINVVEEEEPVEEEDTSPEEEEQEVPGSDEEGNESKPVLLETGTYQVTFGRFSRHTQC